MSYCCSEEKPLVRIDSCVVFALLSHHIFLLFRNPSVRDLHIENLHWSHFRLCGSASRWSWGLQPHLLPRRCLSSRRILRRVTSSLSFQRTKRLSSKGHQVGQTTKLNKKGGWVKTNQTCFGTFLGMKTTTLQRYGFVFFTAINWEFTRGLAHFANKSV